MNYRMIGFGEGDLEIELELAGQANPELTPTLPPVAQPLYVCGWCLEIVPPCKLNWETEDCYVCDKCVRENG